MLSNALKRTLAAALALALLARNLDAAIPRAQVSRAAFLTPPPRSVPRLAPPRALAEAPPKPRREGALGLARKVLSRLRVLLDRPVAPPPAEAPRTPAAGPARLPAPWEAEPRSSADRIRLLNPEGVVGADDPYAGPQAPAGAGTPLPMVAPVPESAQPRPRLRRLASLGGLTQALGTADGFSRLRLSPQAASSAAWAPSASLPTSGRGGDARRSLQAACDAGLARCSSGAKGSFTADFGGTKLTQVSYDASRSAGLRNAMVLELADGRRVEFTASPLVLDLDGDGVRTGGRRVRFDIDGNGRYETLDDVSAGDGVLVFDADGDGVSGEGGRELFGDTTDLDGDGRPDGFRDGFEALRGLVRRAVSQRVLPPSARAARRLGAGDLARLEKAYGLKLRVGGLGRAAVALAQAGVASLSVSSGETTRVENFDGRGNALLRQAGAVFSRADGSAGAYEDVWFRARPQEFRRVAAAW
ncbi:MAG: hypothetical protein HY554_05935 [Elusimicrobia bacterium]|nr:hypothetical protein [Elusimicrobiota bacterium]